MTDLFADSGAEPPPRTDTPPLTFAGGPPEAAPGEDGAPAPLATPAAVTSPLGTTPLGTRAAAVPPPVPTAHAPAPPPASATATDPDPDPVPVHGSVPGPAAGVTRLRTACGLVDGSQQATTSTFTVTLDEDAIVQLDDLVCCTQTLPDGRELAHYGIVAELSGEIEGAEWGSDVRQIAAGTMPGQSVRRATIRILRTDPELWMEPRPGSEVRHAVGRARDKALFLDQMDRRLPVGVDQAGEPVYCDWAFFNGQKGGHVNITGVSGVATKTSYATFLLHMLFETPGGRALLGPHAANTRALVFNVKGEDLLHLDRPNRELANHPDDLARWRALGVEQPGPFTQVRIACPPIAGGKRDGGIAPAITSRAAGDVSVYGWSPWDFVRQGLLRFCFTDDDDRRTQIGMIEQRVRVQLARHAYPVLGDDTGRLVLVDDPPEAASFNFDRVVEGRRAPREAGAGTLIEDFSDLVDFLERKFDPIDADPAWTANTQAGTQAAFMRRLMALGPRLGHLIRAGLDPVETTTHITVVDLHSLHDAAQRFVVGALISRVFDEKQGSGREPLRFVVLDELNKYAPRDGYSPLKELLVDVAERGRSLGVLLLGAQQSALDVDPAIVRNAAMKVAGRLDAGEASEYRFLPADMRERASRFLPGTMVFDQPLIPAPLPLRFPFPGYATNVAEAGDRDPARATQATEDAFGAL